ISNLTMSRDSVACTRRPSVTLTTVHASSSISTAWQAQDPCGSTPRNGIWIFVNQPHERPNRRLDSMAAIARMVRAHTLESRARLFEDVCISTLGHEDQNPHHFHGRDMWLSLALAAPDTVHRVEVRVSRCSRQEHAIDQQFTDFLLRPARRR